MTATLRRVAVLALLAAALVAADGFNAKHIDWVEWDDDAKLLELAAEKGKPVLMLVHKTWCAACKQLRVKVERSAEVVALADHFVMANVEDDSEPSDDKYSPQGSYSPRIMFLHPDGKVAEVTNPQSDPGHLHFYGTGDEIVRGMLAALRIIKNVADVNEL
jgi:protein-disulfide reductase (glutathione)